MLVQFPLGISQKHIDFLLGADNNVWVWVMGEHKHDRTIEQIMEEESKRKAEEEAEKETEKLRYFE